MSVNSIRECSIVYAYSRFVSVLSVARERFRLVSSRVSLSRAPLRLIFRLERLTCDCGIASLLSLRGNISHEIMARMTVVVIVTVGWLVLEKRNETENGTFVNYVVFASFHVLAYTEKINIFSVVLNRERERESVCPLINGNSSIIVILVTIFIVA